MTDRPKTWHCNTCNAMSCQIAHPGRCRKCGGVEHRVDRLDGPKKKARKKNQEPGLFGDAS